MPELSFEGHDEVLAAARRIARDVLAPAAEATDRSRLVPRGHLRALGSAGLFGLVGPKEAGGLAVPPEVEAAVTEELAAACGSTTAVWERHHVLVRALAGSPNQALRKRHLAALCAGRTVGGEVLSHLRRSSPPAVRASRRPGGWTLSGTAPWVTGWALAHVFLVGAELADGGVLLGLLEPPVTGLRADPLALAAFTATGPVSLSLDGVRVTDGQVVAVLEPGGWQPPVHSGPDPATLGCARAAIDLLHDTEGDPAAGAAAALEAELARCRIAALPGPDDDHDLWPDAVRGWSLDLAVRATTAAVVARGPRALTRDDPAQRLAREALAYAVQSPAESGRAAHLARTAVLSRTAGPAA